MNETQQRKQLVRRSALAARGRIDDAERGRASQAAATALLALPEVAAAKTVLAFASFGSEIATRPLIEQLLERDIRVLLPFVHEGSLAAAAIASADDLAPGFRGIPEPQRREPVEPAADLIVVPGVAFDDRGDRLGYGGGFYDVFLVGATGLRVGFCFDCQVVTAVPIEPHDLPVEALVTEARVLRFG